MYPLRTHKIRLNPNNKQATLLAMHCGYARVAYNFGLSSFKAGLDAGEWRSHGDILKEFNREKRATFPWCDRLSQNAAKRAIQNLGDAIKRWKTKQNTFPKYKNRSGKCSYQADNGLNSVKVYKKRILLPKVGWVRMTRELRFRGDITKVVISRKADQWYASILVRADDSNVHVQLSFLGKEPVGVDVGINSLATCSDGTQYPNPRPLKRFTKKLRRAQRQLSKKEYLSNNYKKQKRRVARIHDRIANIREDNHHKVTKQIVSMASVIGVETLKITNMLKNHKLAKALADAALSKFLTMLDYKAKRRGIPIVKAPQFFASSQTCSSCGTKKKELNLSERTYQCSSCGLEIDRDVNAAINLRHVAVSAMET